MENNAIFEPLEHYNKVLKDKFNDETIKYFDALVKASRVDETLNEQTVKKYNTAQKKTEEAKGRTNSAKVLKGFLIFLSILGWVAAIVGGVLIYTTLSSNNSGNVLIPIIILAIGVVVGVSMILIIVLSINKIIKQRLASQKEKENIAKKLLQECYDQMAPLNSLFDWNIPAKIIRKVTPLLQVDDYFDIQKYNHMNKKYGFTNIDDKNTSTVLVLSGSIVGNPFLVVRNLKTYMSSKIYTGSMTITWTERVMDSNGRSRTVTRSQVLHASVSKPCPAYEYNTYLVYGNDAAPDLKFTRSPSGVSGKSEKEIEKHVKRHEDDLVRYADNAVAKGKSFTPMSNTEFEILFGALDRNHEVQFRLLFTPLAQKSELQLIKTNQPYGDDFHFEKRGPLNFIVSAHSQNSDIYANPYNFKHYDLKALRTKFVNYCNEYFKSLFFDLAPLIAIPLYQQHKPVEYIYKDLDIFERNYTNYEEESLANSFPQEVFAHPSSVTKAILKTSLINKNGTSDKVLVKAYSYYTEPRVEYVPVSGGDGRVHNVPVHWDEYFPLEKNSLMGVKLYRTSRYDYDKAYSKFANARGIGGNYLYERGLFAFIAKESFNDEDDNELSELFGYNNKDKKEEI